MVTTFLLRENKPEEAASVIYEQDISIDTAMEVAKQTCYDYVTTLLIRIKALSKSTTFLYAFYCIYIFNLCKASTMGRNVICII